MFCIKWVNPKILFWHTDKKLKIVIVCEHISMDHLIIIHRGKVLKRPHNIQYIFSRFWRNILTSNYSFKNHHKKGWFDFNISLLPEVINSLITDNFPVLMAPARDLDHDEWTFGYW